MAPLYIISPPSPVIRETFLSYPALPSGDYELQLMATNKFGVESEMICIPFKVEKQLWKKTWFRLLGLLLVGTLIWIFVDQDQYL